MIFEVSGWHVVFFEVWSIKGKYFSTACLLFDNIADLSSIISF